MKTTKKRPHFTIPKPIQTHLQQFYQWHNSLKTSLDKLNLSGNEELAHLKKNTARS